MLKHILLLLQIGNTNFVLHNETAVFCDLTLVLGIPPKVIWLRFGNTSTNHLIKILKENQSIIIEFIENPDYRELVV